LIQAAWSALGALQLNLSTLLGPLLGGFLLAAINPDLVFALNAAGFLAIAIALPSCPRVRTAKPFNSRRLARSLTSNSILLGGKILLVLIYLGAAWGGLAPSYWFLLPLAGAAWTLSASELWAVAQRTIRPWASGRVNAAVIMLSQGAMAAGGMVWGLPAHTYGTRPTLAVVATLFTAYLALTAQRNRTVNVRIFAKKNE